MLTAFLSFKRDAASNQAFRDHELAQALRTALADRQILVECFPPERPANGRPAGRSPDGPVRYGQPGWPEEVGKRIAAHADFLVLWSANAAASHIIAFEFHMAMLLQRRITALLTDGTLLRPKLVPSHTVSLESTVDHAAEQVARLLQSPPPPADAGRVRDVVRKLARFNETKPAQVMRKLGIVYYNSRIDNPRVQL